MKTKMITLVTILIALLSFGNAYAQKANPKINTAQGEPQLSGNLNGDTFTACIDYLRLTGLGNATSVDATFNITATATVCCVSPGQQKQSEPNCTPGQRLSGSTTVPDLPVANGTVTIRNLCATIVGACKNAKNFDARLQDVVVTDISVTVQGKTISLNDYLDQVNN